MPTKITRLSDGTYRVSTPNGVKAFHTTHAKALRLKARLDAWEEEQHKKEAKKKK